MQESSDIALSNYEFRLATMGTETKVESYSMPVAFTEIEMKTVERLIKTLSNKTMGVLALGAKAIGYDYMRGSEFFYRVWWDMPEIEAFMHAPYALSRLSFIRAINNKRIEEGYQDNRGRLEVKFAKSVNNLLNTLFENELDVYEPESIESTDEFHIILEVNSLLAQSHSEVVAGREPTNRAEIQELVSKIDRSLADKGIIEGD